MLITDAQVHVWAAESREHPWPPDGHARAHRPVPFGPDELLGEMDAAGVGRAVLVPPTFAGRSNDLAIEAAETYPDRFAVMATVDLERKLGAPVLDGLRGKPGVRGIRLVFNQAAQVERLLDGTVEWLWDAAEQAGFPVMVFPPGRLGEIAAIARRHPRLRLAIDHLGLRPDLRDDQVWPAVEDVLKLADVPNVAVKATSLPTYVTEGYPFPSLHEPIRRVVEEFGAPRVFWGSDLTRLRCSYRELVTLFTEQLDFLSASQTEWIMGRAVCEWLGWPQPANATALP